MLVKKIALNKFLNRIEDVIVREEVFELFKKIGQQGNPLPEDFEKTKELLNRANIPYEDFEKLVKQFKR